MKSGKYFPSKTEKQEHRWFSLQEQWPSLGKWKVQYLLIAEKAIGDVGTGVLGARFYWNETRWHLITETEGSLGPAKSVPRTAFFGCTFSYVSQRLEPKGQALVQRSLVLMSHRPLF